MCYSKLLNIYLFLGILLWGLNLSYSQETDDINDDNEEAIPIQAINKVPHPDQCRGYVNNPERLKQCLSDYLRKIVSENFDSSIADNLPPNQYRIIVQFKIDRAGEITNILAKGLNQNMEDEAIRVMKLVPKMIPGKYKDQAVGVLYTLPINITVPKKKKNKKSKKHKRKN